MIDNFNLFELVEMLLCNSIDTINSLLTACAHIEQLATLILYEVV